MDAGKVVKGEEVLVTVLDFKSVCRRVRKSLPSTVISSVERKRGVIPSRGARSLGPSSILERVREWFNKSESLSRYTV